jgi:hypothetical protein
MLNNPLNRALSALQKYQEWHAAVSASPPHADSDEKLGERVKLLSEARKEGADVLASVGSKLMVSLPAALFDDMLHVVSSSDGDLLQDVIAYMNHDVIQPRHQ